MAQSGHSVYKANAQNQEVALTHAVAIQDAARAADRKIIRNAELSVELDDPAEGQRKIAAVAEAHGGFVVTSEIKQHNGGSKPASTVTMVVRVPSAQFAAVIEKIRGIGGRFKQEKTTGQDVTEEYIDLEARIRTKKALEAQFLEIMKQTRKVEDALQVQSELADVRTEIERLEGRRRFLENQSSLSTITVTLQTPAPVVTANTFGFLHSFKEAFGESIDMGTAIILGIIRLIALLIPILLLIVLPGALALRFLHRRFHFRLPRKQQPVSVVPQPERSEVTAS
jgi:hypothetical protein